MKATFEDWRHHFEDCPRCSLFSPCADGARILEAAIQTTAEILAPIPDEPKKAQA